MELKPKQELKEIIKTPMDAEDLKFYLGKDAKIILYADLRKYRTIEDLLSKPKDFCLLLYVDRETETTVSGHWVALLRYSDTVEYFDSYGNAPLIPLSWISDQEQRKFGEKREYLADLLNNTKRRVVYNDVIYQQESNTINTCGRHATFRIINLMKYNKTLSEYYKIMKKMKSELNRTYDQIVTEFIHVDS